MADEACSSEKAHWTTDETSHLISYLFNNREKVGETGNFKDHIYNAAAEAIAEHWQKGARKTGVMCKTKWASVSCNLYSDHISGPDTKRSHSLNIPSM